MDAVGVQQLPTWDSGNHIVETAVETAVEMMTGMTTYGG
jgi:hypothetical protein